MKLDPIREITLETIKFEFPNLVQGKRETFFHHISKASMACFVSHLYFPKRLCFEYVVPGTHRKRSDVYIESGEKKIIHEIQLAQQNVGYTNHRTKIYKVFGSIDRVVWWFWATDNNNIDFCQENKMDFGIIADKYEYTDDNTIEQDKYGIGMKNIAKEYQYIDDFSNPAGFVSFDLYRYVNFPDWPGGYEKQGFDLIF